MPYLCKECGDPMTIDSEGVSNHLDDGLVDYDKDADHVAIADESELNHITIYGFVTKDDLDNDNEKYIDAITEEGNWEECALSIIKEAKNDYYHITVESDDGKPLPSFQ